MMLDSCEWLSEPEGIEVGQWVLDELIPEIHTRIRQKGRQCPVVMFSRLQPRLDVIKGQDQRRLTLPMLGKAEVDHYLEHMGMRDAELRQRVYEVTHGHALCVSIIGDFWQQREAQEQPLTLADLPELQGQEFSEIALMRFTNERVLRQLKPPFKELTQYGVLLRSFDLPLLRTVFPELLPEPEALERFNQLIRYPFIESRGNYRYAFHELLREALPEETQKEDPEAWKGYHKRALDFLTKVSFHSPDWYYHLLAYDEKQGLEAWQQAIQEARESGKREYNGALLQAALDKALKLSLEAHAEIKYEEGRFNYYGVQWEEALKSYKEALASFKEIEDFPGHANCYQAIGDVQRALGKLAEALENYEKARAFYQQLGDQFGAARSCQAMGDVQRLRNDLDAALQCYERCLVLFRQIGERSEEAKALEAVGDVQRMRNEQDAALKSYEQALALYQEEKDRLKRAKVLKAIGDVQQLRQERNAALESYGQALALYGELKEPAEEASVRRSVEEMGQLQSEQEAKEQSSPKQFSQPGQAIPATTGTPMAVYDTSPSQSQLIRQRPPKAQSPLKVGMILMIGLVLVLLAGSLSLILSAHSGAGNSLNANATATAQANATAQAATATTIAYANATQAAIPPTTSSEPPNPYSGALALNDSLNDNSSNNWFEGGSSNGACVFTGGAYHVFAIQLETTISCPAKATNFSDFAYQIQMTIIKGDFGGLIFRLNTNDNFYLFGISTEGSYNLSIHSKNSGFQTLSVGQSSAINTGLSQPNLIAIVASGSELDLYVNQQLISTVIDGTYNRGQIGVSASASQDQTEVMFSNAQVWTF